MPRNDVAIYSPFSVGLYDAERLRAGGAERQMVVLARALAAQGRRVAHIVYRPRTPVPLPDGLALVVRRRHAGRHVLGPFLEAYAIWRSLVEADAAVVVVRTGTPAVGLAALFCRLRRRRLVFSSASDADFTFEAVSDRWYRAPVYRLGLRLADVVVVQSEQQRAAARRVLPSTTPVVRIPSFSEEVAAEDAPAGPPEWFLWVARAVWYKEPFRFLDLARELPDARFVMVTGRDRPEGDELVAALEREAAALPNLELRQPMPAARLAKVLRRAVAVVNTSRFEGMPNVFLEAWSHGKPVLSLLVDPDGVIARERLGVAAGGSWEVFVDGARRLWKERADAGDLAARARAYTAAEHGVEAVGRKWAEVLAQPPGRS